MVNVLLLVSGSVAAIKIPPLCELLLKTAEDEKKEVALRVVATEPALHFFKPSELPVGVSVYLEKDEWSSWSAKGDPVLHIELRKWADIGIVAPLSANTLGKIANGLADNLLTCILRAWNFQSCSLLLAPAMNTQMWIHPLTERQLEEVKSFGPHVEVIDPVEKLLACNDKGMGAMASIEDIVTKILVYD